MALLRLDSLHVDRGANKLALDIVKPLLMYVKRSRKPPAVVIHASPPNTLTPQHMGHSSANVCAHHDRPGTVLPTPPLVQRV